MANESEKKITIILADDHPLLRNGLKNILEKQEKFEIIGEAGNGEETLKLIMQLKPSIAILDIEMPELDGLRIVEELHKKSIPVRVIILTMYNKENIFNRAMDLKVMGYVMKDSAVTEIVEAVKSVSEGKHYISPSISGLLINRSQLDFSGERNKLSLLTTTERKILKLIAENMTTKEIADELFISVYTVETHRKNICQKLGLHGPNALLHFILENPDII